MNKHNNPRKNRKQVELNCSNSSVVRLPDNTILNVGASTYAEAIRDIVDAVREYVNEDLATATEDLFDELVSEIAGDRKVAIENLERRDDAINKILDAIDTATDIDELREQVRPYVGKLGISTTPTKTIREWFNAY